MNTSQSNIANKPKLLDKVRLTLRANHYSRKTEEAYIGWIKRYILFHNKRHPNEHSSVNPVRYLV
ncbi:phage integrase N-terminal SAM-like domain-containing protein [Ignavibacteria bacterium 4148-Me]|uniref:phage integrase N-terminal SAM-like domain-containing protein n=1 Tax=Rosettibacter primus TaxID=3111523 RepID=UPI00336BDF24